MADKSIVILISGRGSNMEALLNARLPAHVAAVISNEPSAKGLETAHRHDIPATVVEHRAFGHRTDFEEALTAEIERYQPQLVVLAGFMRILSAQFVRAHWGRLFNIHPSLLPAFPGLHTHRQALRAGVRIHGCTVHFVTPELDHGPIVIQAAVPVLPGDTEEELAARVLHEEHRIYPQAVRWFCEGRLHLTADGRVVVSRAQTPAGSLVAPSTEVQAHEG